ncbi:MAG TPA: DUF898 domain-containing protein, partial [Rhizobiales bacterium]|nr:DUF898 domain-containing protein [Hyphomicrobiales bacterium]
GGSTISVTYETRPGLGWMSIKNALLNLITLGIYRFWAKTNVRKHVWSCIRINGEPLEYTGTGLELFIGAMIILFVIFLPFIVIVQGLKFAGYPGWSAVAQFGFTLLFILLFGMAIYRARRYRLSRTLWRGVRGGLEGSSVKYSLIYFGTYLLAMVTAGWSNPAMNLELQERIIKNMRFGETSFRFRGTAGPLYGRYAIAWFSTLIIIGLMIFAVVYGFSDQWAELPAKLKGAEKDPKAVLAIVFAIYGSILVAAIIFGVVWSFYTAYEMAKFAAYTSFDNAEFRFNATGPSIIGLWLGNMLLLIFTLGIAGPFTVQRTIKYFIDRLEVHGWVDIGKIEQSRAPVAAYGEGLLDAFDIDAL